MNMSNHEIAMEAYFYAYNHTLYGGISQKNAIKCYEQIIARLDSDERLDLPFMTALGNCYVATKKRLIKCSKSLFGYKFEELKWDQINSISFDSTLTTGALLLDTVNGKIKISVHRDGAGYACQQLRKLKNAAK